MEAVGTIEGRIQVLDRSDVDTDQIISEQIPEYGSSAQGSASSSSRDWRKEGLELDPSRAILVTGAQLRLRLLA